MSCLSVPRQNAEDEAGNPSQEESGDLQGAPPLADELPTTAAAEPCGEGDDPARGEAGEAAETAREEPALAAEQVDPCDPLPEEVPAEESSRSPDPD